MMAEHRDFEFAGEGDAHDDAGKNNIFFAGRHSYADDDQFKKRQEEEEL